MVWASRSGDGWLWWSVGVVVLAAGGDRRFVAFWSAFAAAVSCVWIFTVLKKRIGRPRPCLPHMWASIAAPDRFSFPSGHAMTAFAICAALAAFYPGRLGTFAFLAASVAASRLVLGLHYLSDVLAGVLIGSAVGLAWAEAIRTLAGLGLAGWSDVFRLASL